jgi:hypothetical protein
MLKFTIKKNTNREIGTFTYFLGDKKGTVITTIFTNHNNKTIAFFLLGTVSQFENSKFVQKLKNINKINYNFRQKSKIKTNQYTRTYSYSNYKHFIRRIYTRLLKL